MSKSAKQFLILFLSQSVVVVAVITLFKTLALKVAALIAASLFTLLGAFMLYTLMRRTDKLKTLLLWAALIHTFVFTLPMLAMRLVEWDKLFWQIEWLGVRATTLHDYSTPFFKLMMVLTLVDLFRSTRFCPSSLRLKLA